MCENVVKDLSVETQHDTGEAFAETCVYALWLLLPLRSFWFRPHSLLIHWEIMKHMMATLEKHINCQDYCFWFDIRNQPQVSSTLSWYVCHILIVTYQVIQSSLFLVGAHFYKGHLTIPKRSPAELLVIFCGFKDFLFTPKIGKMIPFWRAYCSDGLVQPRTRIARYTTYLFLEPSTSNPAVFAISGQGLHFQRLASTPSWHFGVDDLSYW